MEWRRRQASSLNFLLVSNVLKNDKTDDVLWGGQIVLQGEKSYKGRSAAILLQIY